MKRLILSVATALALLPGASASASNEPGITESDYARVNSALVEGHIMPRYLRLAQKTAALERVAADFCRENPRVEQTQLLRESFHNAMQAFLGIQHIRFGPIEYFSRIQRFHFWPQARGKVAGAVKIALSLDNETLAAERFAQSSVAVQGFPAVEYLIFKGDSLTTGRGCRLLLAVTGNLQRMAAGAIAEWSGGKSPFIDIMVKPGMDNDLFRSHAEVTLALFQSLYDGLQFIVDARLKPVVGESPEEARPVLAESRPSERSARNVVDSLAALRALYQGEGGPGLSELTAGVDPELDRLIRKAFRITLETARSVGHPLEIVATDPALRPRVVKLVLQTRALKQIVRDRLSSALDLAVGFNALDGD